mmetsp:Transcript_32558/g.81039  ORF Transcript_32558/g.81039 Transcript_32558/m.81039 type:complete len:106 (+) Transcript_32558:211-528(+)
MRDRVRYAWLERETARRTHHQFLRISFGLQHKSALENKSPTLARKLHELLYSMADHHEMLQHIRFRMSRTGTQQLRHSLGAAIIEVLRQRSWQPMSGPPHMAKDA